MGCSCGFIKDLQESVSIIIDSTQKFFNYIFPLGKKTASEDAVFYFRQLRNKS